MYIVAVDFFMKKIQWTEDLTIKVQIWDIAGRGLNSAKCFILYCRLPLLN